MLQKLYTGEEETPREMHLEALNVFSATECYAKAQNQTISELGGTLKII